MMKKKPPGNRLRRWSAVLLCLSVSAAVLSGCGSGSGKSVPSAEAWAPPETAAALDGVYGPAEPAGLDAGSVEKGEVQNAEGPSPPLSSSRKLIRNVDLSMETDAFDALLSTLEEKISALSGYVERSDVSGSSMRRGNNTPSPRSASMTARIPSDRLSEFIASVEGSGNVTWKSQTTTDVTLTYSDLESRKKSLTIEQERIWALLEKADTLEAVISLEQRLSEIRYELESMESQLRLMDNQVDYSTVTLDIREVTAFTPTKPESVGERIGRGFTGNLNAMGQLFTALFVAMIAGIPIWGPFVVLLVLLVVLVRRLAGKGRKKRPPKPPVPGEEEKEK